MENLLIRYNRLFEYDSLWYYGKNENMQNPFDSINGKPNKFIKVYFTDGRKGSIFKKIDDLDSRRALHVISVFFLGVLFKSELESNELDELFRSGFDVNEIDELKSRFTYLWFMSCLFHDFGYAIENNCVNYPVAQTTLDSFIESEISYNFLDGWKPKYLPKNYDLSTIKNYYDFCRKEKGFINHGHIGALLLYDGLMKNLEEVRHKANTTSDPFEYEDRAWSNKHVEFYLHTSEAILGHNIWLCTKDEYRKMYEDNKLEELIIIGKPKGRIQRRKYPLLFLLALADTIEPIKAFPNIRPHCLLEKVDISVHRNTITIKVLDNCLDFTDWFEKIVAMKCWLDLEAGQENNICKISIK